MRVRDLKGVRYLAQLLAHPGREFHVLDLVAAENGTIEHADSGQPARLTRLALGDAGELSTHKPKTRTADASPRSTTTSSRRAPSETPSGPRRRTQNATSSFENYLGRSASVVAIDAPHLPPSVLESL